MTRTFSLVVVCAALLACSGAGGDKQTPHGNSGDPLSPAPSTATSLAINSSGVNLTSIGATHTLGAEVRDQRGQVMTSAPVSWTSSSAQIASVSGAGVVTAHATGSTSITATSGSASGTVNVVVAPAVAAIVVSPTSHTLHSIGASHQLAASVRDARGTAIPGMTVNWTALPSSIASVSSSGLVTAHANGNATITASVQNISATSTITVQSSVGPPICTQRPVFSEYLIDPASLKIITQIGVVGGGNTEIVGRSYAFPVDGDGVRIPLKAPAAMNVIAARHYMPPGAPASGYVPDWSLVLDAGCGVTLELYHVKDVAASIKAVADTTIQNYSSWMPLATPVPFAAGETFGWYMRGLNSVAFDVIAHDRNTTNQFINQARYETGGSNLLDIVCPWDLFSSAKRDAYLAVIGAPSGVRAAGAGCGTVQRDVAGTAAGQWFTSATQVGLFTLTKNGNYGNPLPILLGVDSTVYVGHTGPSNDIRIARSNASWKDPATITTAWCYQVLGGTDNLPNGWLFLRMNSATQMDVAYSADGLCPSVFPSSGFMVYYR